MHDKKIKLLVVDDHPLVRESIVMLLAPEQDLEVVGSCDSADACYGAVHGHSPDVVLMDIETPGASAFKVAADLRKEGHTARFLFSSAYVTDARVQEILTFGGAGYILKSASVKEIADGVRSVAAGGVPFAAEVLLRVSNDGNGARTMPRTRLALLTSREKEVLRCVASDLSCKEIAHVLSVSARTVDRHKANIMAKLAIHSQVGLALFAIAEGLYDPRSPAPSAQFATPKYPTRSDARE